MPLSPVSLAAVRLGSGAYQLETQDSLLAVLRFDPSSGAFAVSLPTQPDALVADALRARFGGAAVPAPDASGERPCSDLGGYPLSVTVSEVDLGGDFPRFLRVAGPAVRCILAGAAGGRVLYEEGVAFLPVA